MRYRSYGHIILLIGDIAVFYLSLWLALLVRNAQLPSAESYIDHALPFSLLGAIWLVVFLIFGLYGKYISLLRQRVPSLVLQSQVVNVLIAAGLFYIVPFFDIAPKTTLVIYAVYSSVMLIVWRVYAPILFTAHPESAVLVGNGAEYDELHEEIRRGTYPITITKRVSAEEFVANDKAVLGDDVSYVVAPVDSARQETDISTGLYRILTNESLQVVDFISLYEEVFRRLPLRACDESWLVRHISIGPHNIYDGMKRVIDIVLGSVMFICSLPFIVFGALLVWLSDFRTPFFSHYRIGQNGKKIRVVKLRTMPFHRNKDGDARELKPTRIGMFLRVSRIDELPQLLGVVTGSLSLIGPRPELPAYVEQYEREIPYYGLRHSVKPGLSGWAQIVHKNPPKFAVGVEQTRQKLSYDLYYLKNRSLALDVLIILRTVIELAQRRGV